MLRQLFAPAVLVAVIVVVFAGCRACTNCTDYSPPVAGCDCAQYGCGQRAGSAWGGMTEGPVEEYYEPSVVRP